MKIMGKRQIGELEVGELISTLLISEVVSIPIDTPEIPLLNAVIPLLFILSAEILVSYVKNKSRPLKRAVEGVPSFIIYKGKLNQGVLYENRISINEVLTEMRIQGIGNISDVQFCILESNGKLSFFEAKDADVFLPVVIDGELEEENIRKLGISEKWVEKRLDGERMSSVFLMTANTALCFNIIYKDEKNEKRS